MQRPQSGHSTGPVAKVVRHAGQVVSGASGSMTISAAARAAVSCCSSRPEVHCSAKISSDCRASVLATASDILVPQDLPASAQKIRASIPRPSRSSAARARSSWDPLSMITASSGVIARGSSGSKPALRRTVRTRGVRRVRPRPAQGGSQEYSGHSCGRTNGPAQMDRTPGRPRCTPYPGIAAAAR